MAEYEWTSTVMSICLCVSVDFCLIVLSPYAVPEAVSRWLCPVEI